MADEPTQALPAVKVAIEPLSRWTVGQFRTRFQALSPVNTRKAQGVDKAEALVLVEDMCAAITERDLALQAEVDGGVRAKQVAANQRTMLRELTEQIARLRGENPGMGGLPVRAVAEVMGATRQGEAGAEAILADARRRAGVLMADARRVLARAEETAAAGPPELVLPDEPAGVEDKPRWFAECREAIANHRAALVDYQAAIDQRRAEVGEHQERVASEERQLGERQEAVLANLDDLRAQVEAIDLTEQSGETTQAMDVAS